MGKIVVALDFDGTCVKHEYPKVGGDVGAVPWLRRALAGEGCLFVLNTMRDGRELDEAVQWFAGHRIVLYGVNHNPTQRQWTQSPKVYANLYIDDAALGTPLIVPEDGGRPYVNWRRVGPELLRRLYGRISMQYRRGSHATQRA